MQSYHSYECGFDPYGNINYRYDIRFYFIALLFLLFDLELVYLYPIIYDLNIYTYHYSLLFLILLTLGLVYEIKHSFIV